MRSNTYPQLVTINARLCRKGERLAKGDDFALALPYEKEESEEGESFANHDDFVGELVTARPRPEGAPGAFLTREDGEDGEDFFPVEADFWGIEVGYVGESVGRFLPIAEEAENIGWHEILDAQAVRREIEGLVDEARRSSGGSPVEADEISYVALVEITYSCYIALGGTEYDSEVNYRGRLDLGRLHEILAPVAATPRW